MKLLRFKHNQQTEVGLWTSQGILSVERASRVLNARVPLEMLEIIEKGDEAKEQLTMLAERASALGDEEMFLSEDEIEYLPVVDQPEKIICVGLNYIPHAKEIKMETPDFPTLFTKFNNALAGHQQPIKLSPNAKKYDYEAELVIVMGKRANHVSREDALTYVFGYTIGNDLSARDLQLRTSQWFLGKSLDQFAPVGPCLVTSEEVKDPGQLDIECKVNGEVRQRANTRDMMFDCSYLVSYISQYMTLKPGDLIFTGTPEGVMLGYPEERQNWLKPGDEIEISIERLGALRNVLTD